MIQWESLRDKSGEARLKAIQPVREERLKQLGLKLVPGWKAIEMLVVERVRN